MSNSLFYKITILGLLSFYLLSCGANDDGEEQVVHIKEVSSTDSTIFNQEVAIIAVAEPGLRNWPKSASITAFYDYYSAAYDSTERFGSILLDRFRSGSKQRLSLTRRAPDSTGIVAKVVLWQFDYPDSASIGNVLRNWYLEFGHSRKVIVPGVDAEVDSEELLAFIKDRQIHVLQHLCESSVPFNIEDMKENFKRAFSKEAHTIFEVECGGKLQWLKYNPTPSNSDEQITK